MDFITGLPKSGNKSVIMVVVDRLSKYAHFCALPHSFTPTLVAQLFMDQIFKLHGMPTSIVSDHDPIFTSNFRCFTSKKQHLWVQWLPLAEWWYNTNYHATTKMTPYEAVYDQLPPSLTSYIKGCSKVQAVDQLLQDRSTMLAHLRENLHQAQNRMKQQRIGEVAYKLALPPTAKLHPVFHVSCLKKVIGNNCRIQTSLPELDEEGSIWLQPEQVLDTRERPLCGRVIREVLVKWKDTSPEDATWEPATLLQQFPQL
eukprot:PITA_25117